MGVASQVMAHDYRAGGVSALWAPSASGPTVITYPTTDILIKVELFLGGAWVNISSYVQYDQKIRITRGRKSESARAAPSLCVLKLRNSDRRWSPRYKLGPYYGLLKRNNRLRVQINLGTGWKTRFTGYVSEWPPRWTMGADRTVTIKANGVLRRVEKKKKPLNSALFRATSALSPLNYWTLEEGSSSTQGLSATNGAPLVPVAGTVSFGSRTDFLGGTTAPNLEAGSLQAALVAGNSATQGWSLAFAINAEDSFEGIPIAITTDGAYSSFRLLSQDDPLQPQLMLSNGISTVSTGLGVAIPNYSGNWHHMVITVQPVGANVGVTIYGDGAKLSPAFPETVGVVTTPGALRTIVINNVDLLGTTESWPALNSMGHVAVWDRVLTAAEVASMAGAVDGYTGERATDRFARLCAEEGIPYVVSELLIDSETMGPQTAAPLGDLLRQAEAVNEGFIDETFDGELRLTSRNRAWNTPPVMTIDYVTDNLSEGVAPTDDDLLIQNDWTITRSGGTSAQWIQTTGPLNINDPEDDPNGVFRYDKAETLNVEADTQTLQHAALRVARGTIDEPRFNIVPLHFRRDPGLLPGWLEMDNGFIFKLTSAPDDIGGGTISSIMIGYDETIDQFEYTADIVGQPASLENVGITDNSEFVLDCFGSTLAEDLDTTETGIDLTITDYCVWVMTTGPFSIIINGEEMTVTAVSAVGGAYPLRTQTLTVTRSVNGIVREHAIGSIVEVTYSFILVL